MPGMCTWSGGISPIGTISSTSAIVIRPAVAIAGLWLRAVLRKTRLPSGSAFHALTKAKSPSSACSRMYSESAHRGFRGTLNMRDSRGSDSPICVREPSAAYRVGAPPWWTSVPEPVRV